VLELFVERAILFCHQTILDIQNLPPEFQATHPNILYNRTIEQTGGSRLAEVESDKKKIGHDEKTIREILTSTKWNVSETARRLNISRTHLHRLIKKHNIVRGE